MPTAVQEAIRIVSGLYGSRQPGILRGRLRFACRLSQESAGSWPPWLEPGR